MRNKTLSVKRGAPATEAASRGGSENRPRFQGWMQTLLVSVGGFLLIRTFVFGTFVIISGSMEPTLLVGDMLVANRLAVGPRIPGTKYHFPGYAEPARGDVMVFDPHHETDMTLVKRIAGLPGDTLEMRDGVLRVNGRSVLEPWAVTRAERDIRDSSFLWQRDHLIDGVDRGSYNPTLRSWGPLVVPEGHYFMMGDNREASMDSRYWGPLAAWRLEARVSLIYFSYDRRSYRPFPAMTAARWGRVGRSLTASVATDK